MRKAIVVLSGGQDSITCLGLALRENDEVRAITYTYGQRHSAEINAAMQICQKYKVEQDIVDLSAMFIDTNSALLTADKDVSAKHEMYVDLPASFVPMRNALFLTVAYGKAIQHDADYIYAGMCETDYSGYPDCRQAFIDKLETALQIGYERHIQFVTPLMHLNKAETFALAASVGFLDDVIDTSMTCYNGDHTPHEWGMGCAECPACRLRMKGWSEYRANIGKVPSIKAEL